ncbi:MAG: peptide deformylase [Deltaproteobacteria bacterium]
MAIRKIAQLGEPVLRQEARLLRREELAEAPTQRLIDDLIETMRDADGAGLAAPQVYESVQLVVIELASPRRYPDVERIPLLVLANPVLTPLVGQDGAPLADEEAITVYEGCLSVTGVRGRVRRPRRVRVQALDRDGVPLDFVWEGFRAAVVQHEVDHLRGTLFVDRALPKSLIFLREYERYVSPEQRVVDGASGAAPARA